MLKKITISILLSSSLFSNDIESFFKENKININCEENVCFGNNIEFNDTKIDSIKFYKNNMKYENLNLECKDNQSCIKTEKQETLNQIILKAILNNINLTNLKTKDNSIESIQSISNLPILNDEKLTFNSLINNSFDIKIKGLKTKNNEFEVYSEYTKLYLQELNSIPKEEWDDEIASEIEYNLNMVKVLDKLSKELKDESNDINITLSNKKVNNNYDYTLDLNVKSNFKHYNIKLDFTLENAENIEKNITKFENKELLLTLLLPNLNVKSLSLHLNLKPLNDVHNKLFKEDFKYKESYEIVKNYSEKHNIVEEQYKDDKEFVEYNKFFTNLLYFNKNNHYVKAKNLDKLLLTKLLLNQNEEEIDIDKLFDSLDWEFSNND